jgi:O-Antigen ligase
MATWGSESPPLIEETQPPVATPFSAAAAAAAFFLVILTILFGWWAWKQGAYFGPVFYPGAIGLFLVLALYLLIVPCPLRIDGGARLALLALTGLAAWTLLSIFWTPVPAAAVEYSERAFAYAAVLFVAIWATRMLGPRMWAGLGPIAVAGAVVGVVTTIAIGTRTDVTWLLHEDGTLRFPIGYRNANAAFFLISMWALVGLAASGRGRWAVRALGLAAATVVVDLAILSQSRGSIPAFAIAFLVYLAVSPRRLRATAFLALAILPAAPAMPKMLDVYRYGHADPGIVGPLHHAALAVALSGLLSLVVAAIALGAVEPRLRLGPARVRALSWGTGIAALIVIVVGAGVYLGRHGGPVKFVEERIDQFEQVGYPNLHGQGVRFGVNVGSNRHDFWRVSADEGLAHPLLGGGAGSFQLAYLLHKRSDESPRDPHSIEALAFSELGFPGLLLVIVFVVGGCLAVYRSRRRGPPGTAVLVAAGAAGATQWFVHTSYDWFWQYPAIAVAGVFMLGVACAPGVTTVEEGLPRPLRWTAVAWAALLALVAVPLLLSDAYTKRAEDEPGRDAAGAVTDYKRAAELNPLSDRALIGKAVVEARVGDDALAVQTLHEASGRVPDDYVPYYLLAEVLAQSKPGAARAAAAKARSLNPRGPEVIVLQRRLAKAHEKGLRKGASR